MSESTIVEKALDGIVNEPQPDLPKRTPKWFKEYINMNTVGRTLIVSIIAACITGIGAFGGFPEPPILFKQLYFNYPIMRWFVLFLLVWQGAGGGAEFTKKAFIFSLMTTIIIWIIYQLPFVKNGISYLPPINNQTEIDNRINRAFIKNKHKEERRKKREEQRKKRKEQRKKRKEQRKYLNNFEEDDEIEVKEQIIRIALKKEQVIPNKPKQELVNIYNEQNLSVIDIENNHSKELQKYTNSLDAEMTKTIELKESTPKYDHEWKTLEKVRGNYNNEKYNSLNVNVNNIENTDLVSKKPENLYINNTPYQEHNDFWKN
jgi:hypothetical protein